MTLNGTGKRAVDIIGGTIVGCLLAVIGFMAGFDDHLGTKVAEKVELYKVDDAVWKKEIDMRVEHYDVESGKSTKVVEEVKEDIGTLKTDVVEIKGNVIAINTKLDLIYPSE